MMEKFDLVEIVSIITAIFALIVSMVQLRLTFRANIVLRVHPYINRTMLEIVNIGTLGAENVNIKFNNDDIKKIADLVNDETIKNQVMCLSALGKHRLHLLPGEIKPYILYLRKDRDSFGKEPIMLHGVIRYTSFLGIARKKNVIIDVSGTGSAIYENWPTDKDGEEDTK